VKKTDKSKVFAKGLLVAKECRRLKTCMEIKPHKKIKIRRA